jgi:hypothetical protein
MIKSRKMRLAGHIVRMEEKMNVYRILAQSQKEKGHWERLDIGGRMINGF